MKRSLFWIALFALMGGCSAEIGDECSTNADCGQGRICDLSSRAGYCTVTPCEGRSCPEGSACVIFENEESYCMAKCEGRDDCRTGYICDDSLGDTSVCIQDAD